MGASESIEHAQVPSSAQPEACQPPPDGGPSNTALEDDSITVASSQHTAPSSINTLIESLLLGSTKPVGILAEKVLEMRPETREFYENLDAFFELKTRIETIAEIVMPKNAVKKYEDIEPPDGILVQESVPKAELQAQLDVLYAHAGEAKPKFDSFCRKLVHQVGLEPDAIMLEHANRTWLTYTAVPLKARDTAMTKVQDEGDARRLVDIVQASVVVDTEAAFEAVVKVLNENYVANERDGVRVLRFQNCCKKPRADGQRDVVYNIGISLGDCSSSRFICELHIHMKQILDYNEAAHVPREYFRSYFKGGDGNVAARMELLAHFAHRDAADISQIVTSALIGDDDYKLDALDELFYKLSELEIVVLIRRRQLELAASLVSAADVDLGSDWIILAKQLGLLAGALHDQVMLGDYLGLNAPLKQGKPDQAKPLFERSLRIFEKNLGGYHPDVASSLNNLAILLSQEGKYDEATPLYERSLRIREITFGEHHPHVAASLNYLAMLLNQQGKYDEAKPLFERSLRIRETILGEHHPDVAASLNNLATLLKKQGKYDEATPLYERSLLIQETNLGEHHPDVATSLNNLAILLSQQGKYDEAKPLIQRSLRIRKISLGEQHPDVASSLNNLALLLYRQGKYDEAKPLYERALQVYETTLGEQHPDVASSLNNLAILLSQQGKYDEAKLLYERSLRISETKLGMHHPDVAVSLNNLAALLDDQGKYDEAKPLLERSLRIKEINLGEQHPEVANSLNNLGELLRAQGKYDEAKPLLERSLRIRETTLGEHHPLVASSLNNLAILLKNLATSDETKLDIAEPAICFSSMRTPSGSNVRDNETHDVALACDHQYIVAESEPVPVASPSDNDAADLLTGSLPESMKGGEDSVVVDRRLTKQSVTAQSTGTEHCTDSVAKSGETRRFAYGDAVRDQSTATDRTVLKFVDSGAFAEVYAVVNMAQDGRLEAMKIARDKAAPRAMLRALHEVIAMMHLSAHPNIVRLYGCAFVRETLVIFEEISKEGSLEELLKLYHEHDMDWPKQFTPQIALDIARGLAYMHSRALVHWDIKPANVLTLGDQFEGPIVAKIADFDTVTSSIPGDAFRGCTRAYASPETINLHDTPHSVKAKRKVDEDSIAVAASTQDEWSWSCILLELLIGRRPWHDHAGASAASEAVFVGISDAEKQYQSLVRLCMHIDPRIRPRFRSSQNSLITAAEKLLRTGDTLQIAEAHMNESKQTAANTSGELLNFYETINTMLRQIHVPKSHWRESMNLLGSYLRSAMSFQVKRLDKANTHYEDSVHLFVDLVLPAQLGRSQSLLDAAVEEPSSARESKAASAAAELAATASFVAEISSYPDHLDIVTRAHECVRNIRLRLDELRSVQTTY